jgi:predicted 3-demethylubiquinone-9 3-methyltransferase (glyoxalase superfamily)
MKKGLMPCLWFDDQAEEAAKFYTSIFKDGKIGRTEYYPKDSPGKEGSVITVTVTLQGQEFLLLNGGPIFKFNEAVSFIVRCKDQKEVDYYWEKLSKGGKKVQCGWLQDKYGLSWQITPNILMDPRMRRNKEKSDRMFQAMLKMVKLDVARLKAAYDGE